MGGTRAREMGENVCVAPVSKIRNHGLHGHYGLTLAEQWKFYFAGNSDICPPNTVGPFMHTPNKALFHPSFLKKPLNFKALLAIIKQLSQADEYGELNVSPNETAEIGGSAAARCAE